MEKDFDRWNKTKKLLHKGEFTDYVNEREVWWCTLGVNIGSEQDGSPDVFERPVLVVRKFNREMVLVIPLTSTPKRTPFHIIVRHTGIKFAAVISQLRLISTKRLTRKIYQMDGSLFSEICAHTRELFPLS